MANIKTLLLSKFTHFDLDQLVSLYVLNSLLSHEDEHSQTFLRQQAWGETALSVLEVDEAEQAENGLESFASSMDYASNKLQLANIGAEVSGLNWRFLNGSLQIELKTNDGSKIDPGQIKMLTGSAALKQVVFVGLETVDDVKQALQPYTTDLLTGAATVALLFKNPETKIAHQQFVYDKSNCYADLVWQFFKQEKIELNKEQLTTLLTAIYWRTNSLTNQFTNAALLNTAAELLEAGAKLPQVAKQVFSSLNGVERDMWVKALSSADLDSETATLWSEIDRDLAFEYSKVNHTMPVHSPLYFVQGAKASFILLPLSDKYTEVLATTSSKDVRLKALFKHEKFRGDNLQAQVGFHLDLAATKVEILKRLSVNKDVKAEVGIEEKAGNEANVENEEKDTENAEVSSAASKNQTASSSEPTTNPSDENTENKQPANSAESITDSSNSGEQTNESTETKSEAAESEGSDNSQDTSK